MFGIIALKMTELRTKHLMSGWGCYEEIWIHDFNISKILATAQKLISSIVGICIIL